MPTESKNVITTTEALRMLSQAVKKYIDSYGMENQIANELATDQEVIDMLDETLYNKQDNQ